MKNVHRINGKIYITNNQKLRHGFDQCYLNKAIISQRPQYVYNECLIVLTDDEYLINEGIQSIDGKSLEWLVENKRCEYVNIESTLISMEFHKPAVIFHKIILPKEELKQDCCTPIGQIKRYKDCIGCDRKPRQETLEQAAVIYTHKSFIWPLNKQGEKQSIPPGQVVPPGYAKHQKIATKHFTFGANWQQEQDKKLYSELVDLLERLTTIYKEDCDLDIKYDKKRLEFIEQFKNKLTLYFK